MVLARAGKDEALDTCIVFVGLTCFGGINAAAFKDMTCRLPPGRQRLPCRNGCKAIGVLLCLSCASAGVGPPQPSTSSHDSALEVGDTHGGMGHLSSVPVAVSALSSTQQSTGRKARVYTGSYSFV